MTHQLHRRLSSPRTLLVVALLFALQGALFHVPAAAASGRPGSGKVYRVWASPHADRTAATPLRGATLRSGRDFVIYAVPRKPVSRVIFWLDRSVAQRPTRVDGVAPYDLTGTSSAAGRMWRARAGRHVVHIRYVWRAGGHKTVTVRFTAAAWRHRPRPSSSPTTASPTASPSSSPTQSSTPTPTTPSSSPPTSPTQAPVVPAPAGKTWKLSWADEFNATSVDTSKWTTCWDWTYSDCSKTATALSGIERYAFGQSREANGVVNMVAQPLATPTAGACYQSLCRYSSGQLTTARPGTPATNYLYSFTYGYVEGRIRASADSGFWSTFWMLPRRTDLTTDYTHEIDILEMAGERPTTALQTYHYAGRTQWWRPNWNPTENGACPSLAYGGNYHTYGVDWQPDHIAFYLDGKKCGQFSDAANIYNRPMQIILELMVNSSWNRDYGTALTDYTKSSSMAVDYVRVWQAS